MDRITSGDWIEQSKEYSYFGSLGSLWLIERLRPLAGVDTSSSQYYFLLILMIFELGHYHSVLKNTILLAITMCPVLIPV